jgi:hypothetical protein
MTILTLSLSLWGAALERKRIKTSFLNISLDRVGGGRRAVRRCQRSYVKRCPHALLDTSTRSADRARLLATAEWESGLWLQALPCPNIGTFLDNTTFTFRLAASLRLGASIG